MSVRTSITDSDFSFHDNYSSTLSNESSDSSRPATTTSIDLFMRGEPILVDLLLHHDGDICLQDIDNIQSTDDDNQWMESKISNNHHQQQHIIGQQEESPSNVAITCTPPLTGSFSSSFDNNSNNPTTIIPSTNQLITTTSLMENTTTTPTINNNTTLVNNISLNNEVIVVEDSNKPVVEVNIINIVDSAIKPQLFIETKQDNSDKGLTLPMNLISNDNSPVNSEFSSAVSVTSYGSSLPSTPNNSHQSSSFFGSSTAMVTNDETDWEIIVKNRNAQQIARMASATGLVFNNNPNPSSSSPLLSSSLSNQHHHSFTTPKLDTSSLNETSFRKNIITRHSSDQRIIIPSTSSSSSSGESTFGFGTNGKQRRKTSFLWGKSLERKNSANTPQYEEPKNTHLDISASSIESTVTNDASDESFFDFLQSVECRMNVVSIESIESTTLQDKSSKETLKKSKFWDKLKVIKKAIKKQLMEEEKPNSQQTLHTQQPSKHSRTNSTNNLPVLEDCKSTSSSSLTSISDEDKYAVVITKPNGTLRSAEDEMRHCLNDPICLQLFDEFCCQECSQENLLLWKELNKVKTNFKKLSDKRRSKTLRTIHTKFFSENNENFDVNVSGRTKVQIEEQANSKRVSLVSGAHVLNSLQRDCINNLCDSFSRFILTEDYKLWKQNFDR